MIALLQRVRHASVAIDDRQYASIQAGMLALIGFEKEDEAVLLPRLAERILGYRMFADSEGRMNLNLSQAGGALLLVPNFTLAADTKRGMRPGFETACPPDRASALFAALVEICQSHHPQVEQGRFGADMQVSLLNDGPVTFWLQV